MPGQTVLDLGQMVKSKYPGQYDDLSDLDLGRKVKAKYPEYSDFEDNDPGGQMPGVSDPVTGQPVKLPGAIPAPVPNAFQPPQIDAKGRPTIATPLTMFGRNLGTIQQPVNELGQTDIESSRAGVIEFGADLGRAGNRMLQPGTDQTPRIENITGGINDATGTVLSKAWPFAAAAALRFPIPALAGAATGLLGKGAVEGGAALSDKYLDTKIREDYPESLKLTGDVAAMLAGSKGFEKVQGALAKSAAKANTSTEALHRVLSPEVNDYESDAAIRAAIPVIKEYSPDFARTTPTRAQTLENPMAALGRKLGLSGKTGAASTHGAPPQGPLMDPKNLRAGSVVEEFVDSSDRAQDDIFRAFESLVQPWEARGAVLDGNAVADAMAAAAQGDSMIPQDVSRRLLEVAASYRGKQIPIRQAISELRDSNAGANGFFRKNVRAQNTAIATNAGDAAVETARGGALRDAIYGLLDNEAEGRAPAQLMKLWGQINSVKHMAYRKLNPAYKGAEGGGPISALFNIGRAGRAAFQGNPAIAAAAASQAANLGSKTIDDALLKSLLEFGGETKPITLPTQTPPAALLNSGPIRAGAGPDTSGPTGQQPRYGSGMGTATGQRTLPAAESPIRYAGPIAPPPDVSGQPSGGVPRPGSGFSPSRIDQRLLGPATENPDPRTGGALVTPPGPSSYPGQEPEQGLYRTAKGFTDPFPGITGRDRSVVLQQLKASGKASIIVNGKKRMWQLNEEGSIRRLR